METRFKDTNTGEIYQSPRIELDTIKEHKHPVNISHKKKDEQTLSFINRMLLNQKPDRTYVCISCEKPCVRTSPTIPYGCLSHHKHKNSQWKETNIVNTKIKPITPEKGEILTDGRTLWINTENGCILRINCINELSANRKSIPINIHKTGELLNITEDKS